MDALARSLQSDAIVGGEIVGEPRLVGVEQLLSDRAMLRVAIPTRPGAQAGVRRAFLVRVADAVRRGELSGSLAGALTVATPHGGPSEPAPAPG